MILEMGDAGKSYGQRQPNWYQLLGSLFRSPELHEHKFNVGSTDRSPSTYYRLNVFYPFIDHVVTELETRF